MQRVRRPAVAGTFYPADPRELRELVGCQLADAAEPAPDEAPPKALIAPHAGYVYSGPIAATAYRRLGPVAPRIERVVLLGPSHRVFVEGLAAPSVDAFATPLGEIPIDLDAAHAQEHSLEVHLPFLQAVLPAFSLVPLSVGDATAEEVDEVLEALWGGPETLIVVSSDLSHYYPYETARRMDAATSEAIEALRPEGLDEESACGRVPVRGLLVAARRKGLRARTLDLRNSGDTAGPRGEVVGYGAYLFA